MAINKHLTLEERIKICSMLNQGESFKAISQSLSKSPTTISREVKSHLIYKKISGYGRPYNSCLNRFSCDLRMVCKTCIARRKYSFCHSCKYCNTNCKDFMQELCKRLNKPPYVCNGCANYNKCTLEKSLYQASSAHTEYKSVWSETRSGIMLCEDEVKYIDEVVSPLLRKSQSLNHICTNNKDSIMVSESTMYRLVDYNVFSARNIDMPRKVRYSKRKAKHGIKIDKNCRIDRTYEDFNVFISNYPDFPVTEMDTVEGNKGGKVLLTIHFKMAEFMLAFLREANDSQSVIDIIDRLYLELRPDIFSYLMPVCLCDNGSEFSNPKALEFDKQKNQRTHIFYCDPGASYQKCSIERNHEFIRLFVPKGQSFDYLTQENVNTMMNHINSYSRKSLANKCPYEMFSFFYDEEILSLLGCLRIPANEVTLNKSIFK